MIIIQKSNVMSEEKQKIVCYQIDKEGHGTGVNYKDDGLSNDNHAIDIYCTCSSKG